MKTWAEIGASFLTKIKQTTPDLLLPTRQIMEYLSAGQAYLQSETQRCARKQDITIPANNPVMSGVDVSFRIHALQAVWDVKNSIEYPLRDWMQFQNLFKNTYANPLQPNIIQPIIPPLQTDFNSYICSCDDRQIFVFPSPSQDTVLTVHYIPDFPELSQADPYWSDWFTSDAEFMVNYQKFTPEREFYPYTDAFVWYAIEQHCIGFDTKWADKMVRTAQAKVALAIDNIRKHKPKYTRYSQADAHGAGLDYYDPNSRYEQYYGKVL